VACADSLDGLAEKDRLPVFEKFGAESGRLLFEVLLWPYDLTRASSIAVDHAVCPVLFLAASEDKLSAPETVRIAAEIWPGDADFRLLEGFSHFLIGEPGWQTMVAPILDWMDDLS
jgi:pimeloyl-ACP methyl ester carboxylesterase